MPSSNQPHLALLGVPYDASSSFLRGAAEAPPLIRAAFASEASNLWSETGHDLTGVFFDAGDLHFAADTEPRAMIEKAIHALLAQGYRPVSLGGDHSITYPIIEAFAHHYPSLSILHFDAHPDLYEEFEGDRYSHACPFARIMERGLVQRLVQVGIRTLNAHQRAQAARFGVEIIEMKNWDAVANITFETPVYITVDMDGLDPACAPGVSHREPGGATTRQVLDVIQRINMPVVGADIVEFNPRVDVSDLTAAVGAKLLKEIAGQMLLCA